MVASVTQSSAELRDSEPAVILRKLQAVVLLGGSVRATRLREAIGRSMLDLPVRPGRSLLQHWQMETSALARMIGVKRLPVRVMVDREAREPLATAAQDGVILSVERDPTNFRGTGGVLKDLARGYADDDYVLVANAHQILLQDLTALAQGIARREGDVIVTGHREGVVSSLMLVRCGVLHRIGDAGFWDMKEQGLPLIARHHRVEVVELKQTSGMPIRTVSDYVNALRRYHGRQVGSAKVEGVEQPLAGSGDPWAEDWAPTFSLIEEGAQVAPGARVHDSVVLKGARVEQGAVVVRSVVCPGAVIGKGTLVAEDLVEGVADRRRGTI
jgi:hypothetical protein